jgi:hypothetical protein
MLFLPFMLLSHACGTAAVFIITVQSKNDEILVSASRHIFLVLRFLNSSEENKTTTNCGKSKLCGNHNNPYVKIYN